MALRPRSRVLGSVRGAVWCRLAASCPVGFHAEERVARFGRFVADPSPLEWELSFRSDAEALTLVTIFGDVAITSFGGRQQMLAARDAS